MSAKTDRELLELAAKAAGIRLHVWGTKGDENFADLDSPGERWNPLTDNCSALRLAVKLSMSVEISEDETSTYAYAGDAPRAWAMELWRDDRYAATRRAIVRAAAAIGEATP